MLIKAKSDNLFNFCKTLHVSLIGMHRESDFWSTQKKLCISESEYRLHGRVEGLEWSSQLMHKATRGKIIVTTMYITYVTNGEEKK